MDGDPKSKSEKSCKSCHNQSVYVEESTVKAQKIDLFCFYKFNCSVIDSFTVGRPVFHKSFQINFDGP